MFQYYAVDAVRFLLEKKLNESLFCRNIMIPLFVFFDLRRRRDGR